VKARKAARHATSDWMEVEKQRGISVTSSVMQFPYRGHTINLLDTPGHEDFSEDTYRVLTAVDAAVMVIDAAKGVEAQTIKLLDVCRLRNTPIITFVNKLDREVREPIELLDEIESVLEDPLRADDLADRHGQAPSAACITCCTTACFFDPGEERRRTPPNHQGPRQPALDEALPDGDRPNCARTSSWCAAPARPSTSTPSSPASRRRCSSARASTTSACRRSCRRAGRLGAAAAGARAGARMVQPAEPKFTGFVFKIQANMDPKHRDRIAFFRVCSGATAPA
jgi:peptide chain release factor 3